MLLKIIIFNYVFSNTHWLFKFPIGCVRFKQQAIMKYHDHVIKYIYNEGCVPNGMSIVQLSWPVVDLDAVKWDNKIT